MTNLLARFALMSGNVLVGLSVLAPAGMLPELAAGLSVTIRDAGLLVTYGAVVLCIASPLVSWLTTHIGRRMLLVATLAVISVGHLASAMVDSYAAVLVIRLVMLTAAAIYTPQAATTIALIVPEQARASAISFVFLGWSLAIAAGLPLITFLATQFGWRETFVVIGLSAAASALLNGVALPGGLIGHPLSLQSFVAIARSRVLMSILLITLLTMSGQFAITVYLAPLLGALAGAGPATGALFFALLGAAGLIGNVIATSVVARAGVARTLGSFLLLMIFGMALWSLGAGSLLAMGFAVVMLGMGVTAANSMQQARLVVAAPALASATVALNTSFLYIGQAAGSAAAGLFFAHGWFLAIGLVSLAFYIAAFFAFLLSLRMQAAERATV